MSRLEASDELFWQRSSVVRGIRDFAKSQPLKMLCGDSNCKRGVQLLKVALQTKSYVITLERGVNRDEMERCIPLLGSLAQDLFSPSWLGYRKSRDVAFEDTRFMPCDALNRVTKHSFVIEAQAGDACYAGVKQDVCRIVFASNATLGYCGADTLLYKAMKGHESEIVKIDGLSIDASLILKVC